MTQNSLKAFTFLEIIIVIIIIFILFSIINIFIPNNTLQIESDKMQHYFNKADLAGKHYDGWNLNNNYWSAVCFQINSQENTISIYIQFKNSKKYLKNSLNNKELKQIKFNANLSATFQKICFSPFGDLYKNNISNNNLITKNNFIFLKKNSHQKTLIITPTGYIHGE